ncbi:tyrosine-type recombinase/integrase [Lacrimispora indolis]|uniref:tyrosine-type recombinase/integrase n=1 Tax=Lacrimispora indolis TaxID=69825 RepID=UPI0004162CB6|nr:site-specific integrase [[Clostridium] methoxybenzovorans]
MSNTKANTSFTNSDILSALTYEDLLHLIENCDTVTPERLAEIQRIMQKKAKLKEVCDLSKIKVRSNDKRHYIYINRQQIVGKDENDLINKLYNHFFHSTLEGLFEEWLIWRRDCTHVSNKTIKENIFLWNAYFKDKCIVKVPIEKLKAMDFIKFFRAMLKAEPITRKRFNDAKSVLNGLFYYAIELGTVEYNPIKEINFRQFQFKPVNGKKEIFTLEERRLLLDYLEPINDIFSLAVQLDFYLICRSAELRALRWTDIEGENIKIQTQLLDDQTMNDDLTFNPRTYQNVDHIKGNTDYGYRYMPLSDGAKEVLKRIRDINPNGEFILMNEGRQLTTITFNRHLKAYCEAVGIEPRTSHKIRFTVASLLYKHGVPATTLQLLLGHTTLAMTLHYLRDITPEEDTVNVVKATLG